MAVNPPTTPIFSSALALGASMKVMLGLTSGEIGSCPIDWVNNAPGGLACRWAPGASVAGGPGYGMGPPPVWVPNGFAPAGGAIVGNCLKFIQGSSGIRVPGGIPTATQNAKTIGIIYRHRCPPQFGTHAIPLRQLCGFGLQDGIMLYNDQLAVERGGGSSLFMPGASAATQNLASMAPKYNQWTVTIVSCDDATTPKTRLFFQYDFDDAAYHLNSGQGGTVDASAWALSTAVADPCINSQYTGASGPAANEMMPFVGDVALFFIDFKTWAQVDVAALVADPWVCLRAAPTVRTGVAFSWPLNSVQFNDMTTTQVVFTGAPPIGTGTGGTGAPSIQAYRSPVPHFTPGGGNLIASGISFPFTDTPPLANRTEYYYQFGATDGSSTVTYGEEINAVTTAKPDVKVTVVGDSISVINAPSIWQMVVNFAAAEGVRINLVNMGVASSGLDNALATLSWLPTKSMTAVNEVQVLTLTNGMPTGGTFDLNVLGYGKLTGQAWNIPNATLAANLAALPGAGTVTVTGGPLPATATITFSGGAWAGTPIPLMIADGTNLTGGTQVWGTHPVIAVSRTTAGLPSGTASNLATLAGAQIAAAAPDYCCILHGANDCISGYTAAQYQSNLSALIAYLKTLVPAMKYVVNNPYVRTQVTPTVTTAAQILLLKQYATTAIPAVVDGASVFQGDTKNYVSSIQNPRSFIDFTHPDQNTGAFMTAFNLWVNGLKPLINQIVLPAANQVQTGVNFGGGGFPTQTGTYSGGGGGGGGGTRRFGIGFGG